MILIILFFLPGLIKFIENYMVEPAEYFRTIFRDSINAREKNNIKRGDLVDHFINLKNEKQIPEYSNYLHLTVIICIKLRVEF